MTTRNFVPRNNNEGQLGTENKKWNKIYTNEIFATNFTGNLTGTADNAIKDNKNQQIDSTYIKDISVNNDTLIITKGNNDSQDITINNISHAISSDNAINATNADVSKKVSNTATNGSVIDLVTGTMANNDYFRIRIGGSDDAGYAEIATADNGNEPIYIRQYGGSNFGFSNPIRTATILDSSGNTSFPGTVTAPNFNGTATKATQDSDGNAINTTYLKRSGGTMGGALNLANNTLNLSGDDCYFGDQDIAGGFCLKGANGTTNLTLINKDNTTQKASLSYAGGNLISSATIQGNLSGSATKANQDSAGQTINTTYVKGVTANNATLTITKGNGSTSSVIINNVENANTVNVAQNFKFGTGGPGTIYRIFARTSLDSFSGQGNSTFLITCTGDFGSNILGSYIVNISNRGGARMYVRELIPDGSNSTTFGYYISGSYIYFGLSNASYSGECSVTPLNISSNSRHEAGNYKNDSTIPSGWTPVTIEKLAPITSPAFSGTPTAPTPGTSDNSTRVATTAFVQSLINSLKGSIGGTISAASLNENGYVKFSNGFIVQWGRVHLTDSRWEGEVGPFNFPISFSSSCFFVLPSLGNNDGGNPHLYDSSVQQRRWNNSQFWLYQQIMGANPWFAFAHYIAFGR